jgi:ABC-2 type transport system permease protein
MITTGKYLNLDLLSLISIFFFTLLGVLGLGYIFGGLTLIFKRIENYLQIIQFALIGLVAAPVNKIPIFKYLPASWGSHMVRRIMANGKK